MACPRCSSAAQDSSLAQPTMTTARKKPCTTCASSGFGFKSPPPLITDLNRPRVEGARRISKGSGFFGS